MSSISLNSNSRLTPIEMPEAGENVLVPASLTPVASNPSESTMSNTTRKHELTSVKNTKTHKPSFRNNEIEMPKRITTGNSLQSTENSEKSKSNRGLLKENKNKGWKNVEAKTERVEDESGEDDEETEDEDDTTEEDSEGHESEGMGEDNREESEEDEKDDEGESQDDENEEEEKMNNERDVQDESEGKEDGNNEGSEEPYDSNDEIENKDTKPIDVSAKGHNDKASGTKIIDINVTESNEDCNKEMNNDSTEPSKRERMTETTGKTEKAHFNDPNVDQKEQREIKNSNSFQDRVDNDNSLNSSVPMLVEKTEGLNINTNTPFKTHYANDLITLEINTLEKEQDPTDPTVPSTTKPKIVEQEVSTKCNSYQENGAYIGEEIQLGLDNTPSLPMSIDYINDTHTQQQIEVGKDKNDYTEDANNLSPSSSDKLTDKRNAHQEKHAIASQPQTNGKVSETHGTQKQIDNHLDRKTRTNNFDQDTSSAASFEGPGIINLPKKFTYSPKSRPSITSTTSSRGSTTDRPPSQETLDDVLARETLEDSMSVRSQKDMKKVEIASTFEGINEKSDDTPLPTPSNKENDELSHQPVKNKEIDILEENNDTLSSQTQTSNINPLISHTSEENIRSKELEEFQNAEQSNQESVTSLLLPNNKSDEKNKIEGQLDQDTHFPKTTESVVDTDSKLLNSKEDANFSPYVSQPRALRQGDDFPQSLTSFGTQDKNADQSSEQNLDQSNVVSKRSTTKFDDPVEFSYFAMFEPHTNIDKQNYQISQQDNKTMHDRPVVQNIVEDFYSDSQTNKISNAKPVANILFHVEGEESIPFQYTIDPGPTNTSPKNLSEKEEAEENAPPNFRDSPKAVNKHTSLGRDSRSISPELHLDEKDSQRNYKATPENIPLETEMPLIILDDREVIAETSKTTTETFVEEPTSQVIHRDGNAAPVVKASIETNIKSSAINLTDTEKNTSGHKTSRKANEKSGKPNRSPKKFPSLLRSKHSSHTSQRVEDLKAIDRILQGPYSKSLRSPREQVATPRTTQPRSLLNDKNKPTTQASFRKHDTTTNGVKKSTQNHMKPKVSKNNKFDVNKSSSRLVQEKHTSPPHKKSFKSLSDKKKSNIKSSVNKTAEDLQPPTERTSILHNEVEIQTSTAFRSVALKNKSQEALELQHLENKNEETDSGPQQLSGSTEAHSMFIVQTSLDENTELVSLHKNVLTPKKEDPKSEKAVLKTNVNQYQNCDALLTVQKETLPNGGIVIANPTVQIDIPEERHEEATVKPHKTDSNLMKPHKTASNGYSHPAALPTDANNITITTTLVSPSSSKSDVDDIVLENVVVQPPGHSDKTNPVVKSKKSNSSPSTTDAPTTVIIEDETSNIDRSTKTKAGQLILSSIQQKIREKSLGTSLNASSPVPVQDTHTSPSPENSLGNSGPFKAGILRPAVKTTSMSSLSVPHGIAGGVHSPSPEDDTLSMASRRDSTRPSFDAMSRRSVDYRIRTTATVIQAGGEAEKSRSMLTRDESYIKSAIPYLPLSLAVTCLVLNIFFPGLGTILSGVSLLCCGQTRQSNKSDQTLNIMCANCMVGLAQLFTVTFMLVGWFWAIGWGIHLVSLSVQQRQAMKEQRAKELQALALSAFGSGSPKRTNLFGTG